jgi:predicted transcriptional regulator YheO
METAAAPVKETILRRSLESLREAALAYAAALNVQPRALSTEQRRDLIAKLANEGFLQLRGAAGALGEILGIGRTSVYNALNAIRSQD